MTVTANIAPYEIQRFFDAVGVPLAGGKLFTYAAGTTTKQTTYKDSTGGTPNTNPIILDSAGYCNLWLDATLAYKFTLSPATDTDPPTNPIWTVDQLNTSASPVLTTLAASSGSSLVGFLQAGTGAGAQTLQTKNRQALSITDFYANGTGGPFVDPTGTTDSTIGIQNAINAAAALGAGSYLGGQLITPPGRFKISGSLTLPGAQFVSLLGCGKVSQLVWAGGNNTAMILMDSGSAESAIYVEKIALVNGNAATGLIGFRTGKTAGNAFANITLHKNFFLSLDQAAQVNTETDEFLFDNNYVLTYTTAGVNVVGGTNSNIRLTNNQFRDGSATSTAVLHAGGNQFSAYGNTIQNANQGSKGFALTSVIALELMGNYFEVAAANRSGDGPFVSLTGCVGGVIEGNFSAGDVGDNVMLLDTTCANIRFGPNTHNISGGTPSYFINIGVGSANVTIDGLQSIIGGSFPIYSGNPTHCQEASFLYTEQYLAKAQGLLNINSVSTATIFTGAAGQGYLVTADQVTEGYAASSIVIYNISGAITLFSLGVTNANFTITASGLTVVLNNGITATRTCNYVVTRIF